MKILFLDIDGVVNSYRTIQRYQGMYGIDPDMAAKVRQIVADTGCSVVLSSTWRMDHKSREHVRKRVCDFIDCTPTLSWGRHFRGDEINAWLADHPEVTRYAILDDDPDFHPGQPLFQTSFSNGLTDEIAQQITEYLQA